MNKNRNSKAFFFDRILHEQLQKHLNPVNLISHMFQSKFLEVNIQLDDEELIHLQSAIERYIPTGSFTFELDDKHLASSGLTSIEVNEIIKAFIVGLAAELEKKADRLSSSMKNILAELCEKYAQVELNRIRTTGFSNLELIQSDIRVYDIRLRKYWGRALDWLEMLIGVSIESGELVYQIQVEPHLKHPAPKTPNRYQVLLFLHARACQIAGEILTLLKTGFADGAFGRWRSLHEVCVVGVLIAKAPENTATRYYSHIAIEDLRYMEAELNRYPELHQDKNAMRYYRGLLKTKEELIEEFGIGFETDYGWAGEYLNKRKPTFRDLEAAAEIDNFRTKYKKASLNVHGSAKGTFERLGIPGYLSKGALVGRSDLGLEHAGDLSALSLGHLTITLLTDNPTMDMIVRAQTVSFIWPEVSDNFLKAAAKLKRDMLRTSESKIIRRFQRKR